MCSAWMTHAQSRASFTSWRWKKRRKTRRAILLFVLSTKTTKERFLLKRCQRNGNQKRIALPLLCRANYIREILNTLNILSGSFIIYSLKRAISGLIFILNFISLLLFNKSNTWRPTCFIVQTTSFNRPAKFVILLKHWGYDNFELNWFHGLSKSPAIPFSQVSADSFCFIFRNALDLFTLSLSFARHVLHGV